MKTEEKGESSEHEEQSRFLLLIIKCVTICLPYGACSSFRTLFKVTFPVNMRLSSLRHSFCSITILMNCTAILYQYDFHCISIFKKYDYLPSIDWDIPGRDVYSLLLPLFSPQIWHRPTHSQYQTTCLKKNKSYRMFGE